MKRFYFVADGEESKRLEELANALGSFERKPPGRVGPVPFSALVRDMMRISEVVVSDYAGVVRQAINGQEGE